MPTQHFTPLKLSTPSKISYGSDARSRSNPIPRCPVKGILLLPRLQWTPNYPQLGPPTIHGGAHPTKLPQGVRPHPSSDFPTTKYTLSDSRMQSTSIRRSTDFLTPIHTVYALPILPLCIAFMRIKYYSMLYILQHSRPSTRHADGISSTRRRPRTPLWIGCAPTRR